MSAGDLCQPGGPDGEGQAIGQARKPRGESKAKGLSNFQEYDADYRVSKQAKIERAAIAADPAQA